LYFQRNIDAAQIHEPFMNVVTLFTNIPIDLIINSISKKWGHFSIGYEKKFVAFFPLDALASSARGIKCSADGNTRRAFKK